MKKIQAEPEATAAKLPAAAGAFPWKVAIGGAVVALGGAAYWLGRIAH